MAATHQVAREAWRIFVATTRGELYEYLDSVHAEATARWRSYDGNRDRCDLGPYELNTIDWYRRNRNWDDWLKSVHKWAGEGLKELSRRVNQFQNVCSCAVLVFRGEQELAMDETLYLALEETKDVLGCFIHGWQNTCFSMTLAEWCSFGAGPGATTRWNISLASREAAISRQLRIERFVRM
jgi:hypothetical protein